MLAIRLAATPALSQWSQTVHKTEQQITTAAMRALNKTARWMHNKVATDTAQELAINVGAVRGSLTLLRASTRQTEAGIALGTTAGVIKAVQLGSPTPTARGTRVGKRHWDHAFIATMPNGHRGVFRRTGAARLPIQEVQLVVTGRIAQAMQTLADGGAMAQFQTLFERELRYLSKAA